MRFDLAVSLLVAASAASTGAAFASSSWGVTTRPLSRSALIFQSTISPEAESSTTASPVENKEAVPDAADVAAIQESIDSVPSTSGDDIVPLTSEEVVSRLTTQLEKLRQKDTSSTKLNKEDISVVYEDEHLIVVDKPTGVLSVGGKHSHPNLADAVCEAVGCEMGSGDRMVVHRLGMDTSGLMCMAKAMEGVRGMNTVFRTRAIERTYEALVGGHVEKDEGMINLPIMRDYEFPPFMRISTDAHQKALVDLDAEQVGKRLLEAPKDSITKYQVIAREELDGSPVTRVALTSISGRTHQLNVHMAAFGHPLVGDTTYGINGDAAKNGGLSDAELDSLAANPARADTSLQEALAVAKTGGGTCVHAKTLKFRHPVTNEDLTLSSDAPF